MYIYVWRNGRFGKYDKMMKISGKVDKSNTYNGFPWIKDKILLLNCVSVQFIHFSLIFVLLYIYIYSFIYVCLYIYIYIYIYIVIHRQTVSLCDKSSVWLDTWDASIFYELYWTNPGSTKQQLYGCLPPISKIIQIRQTRQVGYYYFSRQASISWIRETFCIGQLLVFHTTLLKPVQ